MADSVRGSHTSFKATFVDEDGNALVASDEVDSPTVQIKSPPPESDIIWTGTGLRLGDSGEYMVNWFCPEDLDINVPTHPYSIEWFFTDLNGHNHSSQEFFNVVDSYIPDLHEAQFTYLVRYGKTQLVIISSLYEPKEIAVRIMTSGMQELYGSSCIAEANKDAATTVAIKDRKIGHLQKNGLHYYFYNTDPLGFGEWPVFWELREDAVSAEDEFHQTIRVPENNFWLFVKPLQLFIDKVRKKFVTFQGYTTDQLYEFIQRGVGTVNGLHPVTSWTLNNLPLKYHMGVSEMVLLAAAKWAFYAQQTLEEELSFDHSGQTVGLSVKHDYSGILGMIEGELSKWEEKSKPMIQRIMCPIGRTGVRPYRYGFSNRVWKLGLTGTPQDNFYGLNALWSTIAK